MPLSRTDESPRDGQIRKSSEGSAAAARFFGAVDETGGLLHFVTSVVLRVDWTRYVAGRALETSHAIRDGLERPGDPEHDSPAALAKSDPGPATRLLREHRQVLLEMVLARMIDHYAMYLTDVISEVLSMRPEILSSREQIDVETVMEYDDIDSLKSSIIGRKIEDLSYAGFAELAKWCQDRLGLDLVDDGHGDRIVELIETRNIIVHNRCRVGQRYIQRVGSTAFVVGDLRPVEVDYLDEIDELLHSAVQDFDTAVVAKFGVPVHPFTDTVEEVDRSA